MNRRRGVTNSIRRQTHRRWVLTFPNQEYWHQQREALAAFLNKPIKKSGEGEGAQIEVVYQWDKGLEEEYIRKKLGDDKIGIRRNTFKGRPGIRPNSSSPPNRSADDAADVLSNEITMEIEAPEFSTIKSEPLNSAGSLTTTTNPSLYASSISAFSNTGSQISSIGINNDDNAQKINSPLEDKSKTDNSPKLWQPQPAQSHTNLPQNELTTTDENEAPMPTQTTDELYFQNWLVALEEGASLDDIRKVAATLNKTKLFFDRKKILETAIIDFNTQKYIKNSLLPRYKQILKAQRQTLQDQSQNCLDLLLEEQLSKGNSYIFNILYENREQLLK